MKRIDLKDPAVRIDLEILRETGSQFVERQWTASLIENFSEVLVK